MSNPKQEILDQIAAAERDATMALDRLAALKRFVTEHLEAQPAAPQPATPRFMLGFGYESLFSGNPLPMVTERQAAAWKEVGIDVVRYTIDMSRWSTEQRAKDKVSREVATMRAAGIERILLDLRYIPTAAVRVPPGAYREQCRACAHGPDEHEGNECHTCRQAAADPRVHPDHRYFLADPRTAYMEGVNGPLMWNDWRNGALGTHYAKELDYCRDLPHIDPVAMRDLGKALGSALRGQVWASSCGVNEPEQGDYWPPCWPTHFAFQQSRFNDVPVERASSVRRLHDEVVIPMREGLLEGSNGTILCVGPEADNPVILAAVLEDEKSRLNTMLYKAITHHPYPPAGTLQSAIEHMDSAINQARPFHNGRKIWCDEWDDGNGSTLVPFVEAAMQRPEVQMVVLHQSNRAFNGDMTLNDRGRALRDLRR